VTSIDVVDYMCPACQRIVAPSEAAVCVGPHSLREQQRAESLQLAGTRHQVDAERRAFRRLHDPRYSRRTVRRGLVRVGHDAGLTLRQLADLHHVHVKTIRRDLA